jgi:hypothetical protein
MRAVIIAFIEWRINGQATGSRACGQRREAPFAAGKLLIREAMDTRTMVSAGKRVLCLCAGAKQRIG